MIVTGQVAIGTAPTKLLQVPPGINSLTLICGSVASYIGGSGVTTSNGAPLAVGAAVTIPGFVTSAGTILYAATGAGSGPVGFILSTAE